MDDQGLAQARRILKDLDLFRHCKDRDLEVTRLGGLTNLVFRIDQGNQHYVLRVPGQGTEEYINRIHEVRAALEAARVRVSPAVLHADPATGVMVTRFIDDAGTMSAETFKAKPGAPARAGAVFRRLHGSDALFTFRFELFAMIDDYLKVLAGKDTGLPVGYHDVVKEAETVRAALNARALPHTACHCDPLCENFLDTGERMWLVDWEYSGMNDPLWDLGDLSIEGGFSETQDEELLRAYFGGEARPTDRGRMVIYKAMCDLLWTLWGLIQHANSNPVDDFWAYALRRFERCKALMAVPEFRRHVRSVLAG
ncbi:MAG TPA: choline/ethanolamine kinase family protein [Steroidobacteraceae bacterium]|nr:choline/ethanolamine kinase family protein [Steroidobacteraceae bacterium]